MDFESYATEFFDGKLVWWEEYFQKEVTFPLAQLKNAELRLGGERIVTFQHHTTGGGYDEERDRHIGEGGDLGYQGVCIYLKHARGTIKVDANICQWPKSQQDRSSSEEHFLDYLVDTVAQLPPQNKYVSLSYITFDNRLGEFAED